MDRRLTDAAIAVFRINQDDEIRLIAELDGELVGIGALVLAGSELRACYVVPTAARKGVGSALVAEIERIARQHGLMHLEVTSSLTAKPFDRALGYEVGELSSMSSGPVSVWRPSKCARPSRLNDN